MAGSVNKSRRTDNHVNGFPSEALEAAQTSRDCYRTLVSPPSGAARVTLICAGSARGKTRTHINSSGYSHSSKHNSDVSARLTSRSQGSRFTRCIIRRWSGEMFFLRQDKMCSPHPVVWW